MLVLSRIDTPKQPTPEGEAEEEGEEEGEGEGGRRRRRRRRRSTSARGRCARWRFASLPSTCDRSARTWYDRPPFAGYNAAAAAAPAPPPDVVVVEEEGEEEGDDAEEEEAPPLRRIERDWKRCDKWRTFDLRANRTVHRARLTPPCPSSPDLRRSPTPSSVFLGQALSRPFVIGTNHISDSASSTRLAAPGWDTHMCSTDACGGRAAGQGAAAVFTQDVAVALEAVHQVPRLLRVVAHVGDEHAATGRGSAGRRRSRPAGARCEMRVAWWKAGSVRRVCVARTRGRGPTPPRSSGTCPSARRS